MLSGQLTDSALIFTSGATTLVSQTATANTLTLAGSTGGTTVLISNATDPVLAQDVATKNYVDSKSFICSAASTVNLTATYSNGTLGVGATLTNSGTQVAFAIDGYTAALNDRILVKNQTSAFQNGIYKVTTLGSGSTNWVLTRTTDYDTISEIQQGNIVPVINGTINASTSWIQNSIIVTMGTTDILFTIYITTNMLFFGDGSDGAFSSSSGTTTLSRDTCYTNLTLSGTAKIVTNGYRIFVSDTLDLTASGASAINFNGNNGNNATGTTGGTGGAVLASTNVGGGNTAGGNGGNGNVAGSAGGVSSTVQLGGNSINGGRGGTTGAITGSLGGTVTASTILVYYTRRWCDNIIKGTSLLIGGQGGGGGGGATNAAGGGGGGGGSGGGLVWISAKTINRGASTAVSSISATGGTGGTGGNTANNTRGGGGGGSGGGGGLIYLAYGSLIGTSATNALDVSGAAGGNGGNGLTTGFGGAGGGSGGAGQLYILNLSNSTSTVLTAGGTPVAGTNGVVITGGAGASANVYRTNL